VATPAAHLRSRERVGQVCAAGGDPLTLRLRLIDELRRVVGFDWYAFVLTDPQTMVGCAPLADVPATLLPQLPRLIRLKYLTPHNRWTTIGPNGVALLRRSSGDEAAGTAAPHEEEHADGQPDDVSSQREAADQGVGGQHG
jgi:hypothetical protein